MTADKDLQGAAFALEDGHWLANDRYDEILYQTRTILFEYHLTTQRYYYSPYISQCLSGNYDGRKLLDIFIEDGVVYPQDQGKLERFLEQVLTQKGVCKTELRLKTRAREFHWFRAKAAMLEGACCADILMIGVLVDADEEIRMRESLRYRAEFDTATGIFNKATFFRETEKLMQANPLAGYRIVRFDIDRFKIVNELFSTAEGDRVLRYVGLSIKELVKKEETYARMGNDVFCICLCRDDQQTIELIGALSDKINEYPLDFNLVVSAGIFRVLQYEGQPVNILCDRAALAQRTIKGSYIRQYAFYEQYMGDALSKEHYIIGSMRKALAEGQFVIYLQAKFDLQKNTVLGAEALARWNHPDKGLIPPGEFIPLFEQNGFILKLDEYIWELACKTLRSWLDRGLEPVPISVNVSRLHLYDVAFCDKIIALAEKYHLNPRLLELEITESAYTENEQYLYSIMERLQKLHFTFSMDDFGSGYSSLNILKDIPVDVLKIDLNFLRESRRGQQVGRTILESTIHMAQKLNLPVIAEGVETSEQADVLMQAGCTGAQGYYYARPMPVEAFEHVILKAEGAGKGCKGP